MSKRTIVLLNEKSGWVAGGQDGGAPELQEWLPLDLSEAATVEMLADSIVKKMTEARLPKRNIILVLGPSYLEYRPFQVPPVETKELPAITQMLARNQLTQTGENSIVDFVSMPNSATQQGANQAFVGATTQRTNALLDALKESGVSCSRILPRPTALGLLHNDPSDRQFWISVFPGEVDVFVAGLEQLLLVRSSILPAEGEARAKTLRREVSRTLAVLNAEYGQSSHHRIEVAGQLSDCEVVQTVFAETEAECHTLQAGQIGKVGDIPVTDQAAAVLAMAVLSEKHPALLDFANPTQPPKDFATRRKMILVGAAVATAALCLVFLGFLRLNKLDSQIAALELEIETLAQSEEMNNQTISDVGKINQFVTMDANPLELLSELSQQFPYGDEIRLKKLQVGVGRRNDDSEGYSVQLDSVVAGQGLERYREALKSSDRWETEPDPTADLTVAEKSKIYNRGINENLTYFPDFFQRYEGLENVYFSQLEDVDSASEQSAEAADGDEQETDEAADGDSESSSDTTISTSTEIVD